MSAAAPMIIYAPGSLAGAAPDLLDGFLLEHLDAVRPEFHFAMSGTLAQELLDGAFADVAVFADRGYADAVRAAGMLDAPRALTGNRLALMIQPERAAQLRSLWDLAQPGVRVALFPAGLDPCGAYTAALIEREGLTAVFAAKYTNGEAITIGHDRPLRALLADGKSDAAVGYVTFARGLTDIITLVPLPDGRDMRAEIVFTVGAIQRDNPHPLTASFVAWLLSAAGQSTLQRHGFLTVPGR